MGSAVYAGNSYDDYYYGDYFDVILLDSINRCNIYNNPASLAEITGVRTIALDTFTVSQPSFYLQVSMKSILILM